MGECHRVVTTNHGCIVPLCDHISAVQVSAGSSEAGNNGCSSIPYEGLDVSSTLLNGEAGNNGVNKVW